jgi:hypothetical protein
LVFFDVKRRMVGWLSASATSADLRDVRHTRIVRHMSEVVRDTKDGVMVGAVVGVRHKCRPDAHVMWCEGVKHVSNVSDAHK